MDHLVSAIRANSRFLNELETGLAYIGLAYLLYLCFLASRGQLRNPPIRVIDLLLWSQEPATSVGQIQKAYDWHIAQWSAFGTAVLTAILGFISAVILEVWKGTKIAVPRDIYIVTALGIISSIALYAFSQYRIQRLRTQFLRLYSALALLNQGV
jgi:hypothetical protein